jgi:hypothetical protein
VFIYIKNFQQKPLRDVITIIIIIITLFYVGFKPSLTLRVEHIHVLKSKVLRNMSGPNREERVVEWRKLHNEELHDMYSSPDTVRVTNSMRMRWAEHAAGVGQMRNAYRGLVCKTEGRREDNIKMDFHKIGGKGVG